MRMPVEIGDDGNTFMWSIPSFTDPSINYEIHVNRHDGMMYCSCMDAVCRHKVAKVTDSDKLCKHCKAVLRILGIREKNKWSI